MNAVDYTGNTPLHYMMIYHPSIAVCEFLTSKSSHINLKNSLGLTPTHIAIIHQNYALAALLIKQPTFDLFALTNTGKSYLTFLTHIRDDRFHEIKAALETRKGELMRLIETYCNEVDDNEFSNLFHSTENKYLLDLLIAQPHIRVDSEIWKPSLLHKVGNDVKFAKFLVDMGSDLNRIDSCYRTPLIQALTGSHGANIDVVRYLIEVGANVNCATGFGFGISPLRVACEFFNLELIRILLEAGADFSFKDSDGKTPFECLPIEYRSIINNIVA